MQELVRWALEAEVTELLGRARYQRRAEVDASPGYRNGYGKPRKLSTPVGVVTLRRPRVRGLEERFVSPCLPGGLRCLIWNEIRPQSSHGYAH